MDASADTDELKAFLKHVLPEFDQDKVYPSDIKKLVAWYKTIHSFAPEVLATAEEIPTEEKTEE